VCELIEAIGHTQVVPRYRMYVHTTDEAAI